MLQSGSVKSSQVKSDKKKKSKESREQEGEREEGEGGRGCLYVCACFCVCFVSVCVCTKVDLGVRCVYMFKEALPPTTPKVNIGFFAPIIIDSSFSFNC